MKLPSNFIHQAFSEIDVTAIGDKNIVSFSLMMELGGDIAEGWKTGIALDASISMIDSYGKGLEGTVPENVQSQYQKKGWITTRKHDGNTIHYWKNEAFSDAIKLGYLKATQNVVENEARKFSSYLAQNLDENNNTDLIYWACDTDGKGIEEIGVFNNQKCNALSIVGPLTHKFGQATYLLPALEYFEKKYRSAKRSLFIFLTDGALNDLKEVKDFTINRLCKEITAGRRSMLKAVIVGIGSEVNEAQMIELDDLDSGTEIDVWDHKIAKDMKDVIEIFAELVDENKIVAPLGVVYDSKGNTVKKYNDGVPARGEFELSLESDFFVFEVGNQKIKQIIRN